MQNEKKPVNIVWILMDHQIFKHHDFPGNPYPELPTYDRISGNGVRFDKALSICPICTPARGSMLTGVYPHKHKLMQNTGSKYDENQEEFSDDTKLFNYYLQKNGYRCGYFGKWHCGGEKIAKDYGFEGFSDSDYGYPYALPEYKEYLKEKNLPEPVIDMEWHYNEENIGKDYNLTACPKGPRPHMGVGVLKTPEQTHESYFIADRACKWMEERAKSNETFCLRVDPWGPHHPYYVPEAYANTIDPNTIKQYKNFSHDLADRPEHQKSYRERIQNKIKMPNWEDWPWMVARAYEHVHFVDKTMGMVLDTIERLGLTENTMVIYTADHGDALASHGGIIDKDSFMAEETMRIPMAISWPGNPEPGKVLDCPVTNMDIVPTILEAANIKDEYQSDGEDLLGFVTKPETQREDILCEHHGHGIDAYQRYLRYKNYVYVAHLDDLDELYDIEKDPYQLENKIQAPAFSSILKELKQRVINHMKKFDDVHTSRAKKLLKKLN